eukprot:CAMPEP_0118661278 /NCGR_PEP_ID=MMETSP0785-20121206/16187_1 /TAXON_ID=91992 /ORGANISM="Bolidomonas pacifica, Strain CCMP 1866" /LENGTH=391 /DNA_ID=CAMNT_0006554693 /DNA_START=66 /DNA_END=1237 /DNA_ORIENTATION=-
MSDGQDASVAGSLFTESYQVTFEKLKKEAAAISTLSEEKLTNMFKEHLKATEELCLSFTTKGSTITDTDVKLLGPRLKAISEAFLKNTQENDMHIKQIEELFDSKVRDMKSNFELGIRRERKACEETVARLEEEVKAEKSRGEANLKELVEQHRGVVEEMQKALEEQGKEHAETVRRHEKDFLLKQNAILSNLKKAASEETEKIQAESLVNMEKAAKEAIQRQRDFYDMEKKAERAAAEKFQGMVGELREKWEEQEKKREEDIEARVRAEYEGRIASLKKESQLSKKMASDAQTKWMDVVTKQNYKHQEEMSSFSDKCSREYESKLDGMVKRVEDQFNVYERQLLEKDEKVTRRTMDFEGKLQEMKSSLHVWKEEYQRSVDARHAEAVTAL